MKIIATGYGPYIFNTTSSDIATFYNEDLRTTVTDMVMHELDGEHVNSEEMGLMISKYLRRKHHYKEEEQARKSSWNCPQK